MSTFGQIITRAKKGNFNDMETADALEYAQDVHNELMRMWPFNKTTKDLTLVAGTREYALDDNTLRVWSADYIIAEGTQPMGIRGVNIGRLDELRPGWRNDRIRGVPGEFYLDVGEDSEDPSIIGFDPCPSISTSGSYPLVRLYVTKRETIVSGDDLPAALSSEMLYIAGIRYRFCMDQRPKDVAAWRQIYRDELASEESVQAVKNARARPEVIMNSFWGGGTV